MILLNFKGTAIKGDSTVDGHKDWITVDTFQMGAGRAISSSGGGKDRDTSNPSVSDASISRSTDVSSPEFFMQSLCGKSLGAAELHWVNTGGTDSKGQVYLAMELGDVMVSSYSFGSSGDRPSENIALNFTSISYQTNGFDGKSVTTGTAKKYDFKENKAM